MPTLELDAMVHLLELCHKILIKLFKTSSTGYCYILVPIPNTVHRNLVRVTL
jgi:hypothetical protein